MLFSLYIIICACAGKEIKQIIDAHLLPRLLLLVTSISHLNHKVINLMDQIVGSTTQLHEAIDDLLVDFLK